MLRIPSTKHVCNEEALGKMKTLRKRLHFCDNVEGAFGEFDIQRQEGYGKQRVTDLTSFCKWIAEQV